MEKKHEKVESFLCRGREILAIYSWIFLVNFKCEQNSFNRIPISHFPEISALGTSESILLSGCHGNSNGYKNFNFYFRYVFASSMTEKFHYHQDARKGHKK